MKNSSKERGNEKETRGADKKSTEVQETEIDHDQWQSFLENFSRYHLHWPVIIEQVTPTGKLSIRGDRRLIGINLDETRMEPRANIQMGESSGEKTTHSVSNLKRISLKQTRAGAHVGLELISADGSITFVRFRTAVPPEMLDGIAA